MLTRDWIYRAGHAWTVGLTDTPRWARLIVRVAYTFGWLHSPSYVGQPMRLRGTP